MTNKNYDNFLDYKRAFINKHSKSDWTCDTSSMDSNGKYTKWYNFTDGSQLIEINEPIYEDVVLKTIVHGVEVEVRQTIKLFRTETWNTDDATSVFFYEKF